MKRNTNNESKLIEYIITSEKQKEEAIKRMEIIGLSNNMKKQFTKKGAIPLFMTKKEDISLLIDLSLDDYIKDFETKNNVMVYCVIVSDTELGPVVSLIYISDFVNEKWDEDKEQLRDGYAKACNVNLTKPSINEISTIRVEMDETGELYRIA